MVVFSTVSEGELSGRQALAEINRGLETLKQEEERLSKELSKLTAAQAAAWSDENGALADLARFKLSEETAGIGDRLDQASQLASELMAARQQAWAELEKARQAKSKELAKLQGNLDQLRADLDMVEDRIEELTPEVEAKLADDDEHQALVAKAEAAGATAQAAARKAEQAEADRAQKSIAYRDDPLFMYLWRRGFGTPSYRHSGLTRTLDRWVSNVIGFLEARPSFVLLNEIPERLRTHAERTAEVARETFDAVTVSANSKLTEIAGEDLSGRANGLADGIAAQELALEPIEEEVANFDVRAAAYAAGEDEQFRRALESLSRSIAAEDIRALREQAERTPSPDDERYVERLSRARDETVDLAPKIDNLRKEVAEITTRREDLLNIARDFRRRGWENRGHSFEFGDMMTGFMLGRVSRGMFWGGIARSHRGVAMGRGGFGGFGGGGFGGGGFGGGGFSGGGGFGGGGFRTGGGF